MPPSLPPPPSKGLCHTNLGENSFQTPTMAMVRPEHGGKTQQPDTRARILWSNSEPPCRASHEGPQERSAVSSRRSRRAMSQHPPSTSQAQSGRQFTCFALTTPQTWAPGNEFPTSLWLNKCAESVACYPGFPLPSSACAWAWSLLSHIHKLQKAHTSSVASPH